MPKTIIGAGGGGHDAFFAFGVNAFAEFLFYRF
jgi:hypothetical protein